MTAMFKGPDFIIGLTLTFHYFLKLNTFPFQTQLDQMHQEITRTLEKITSREKYINSQMEGPIAEYRRLKDR